MLIFLSLFMYAHPVMWKGAQDYSIRYSESFSDIYGYYTLSRYSAVGLHIVDSIANNIGVTPISIVDYLDKIRLVLNKMYMVGCGPSR